MLYFKRILSGIVLILAATAAMAQQEYRVRPGDTLAIEVLEDTTLNRTAVVLPDGRFSFPFAGTIPAAGRTVGQIQNAVTQAIASNFAVSPNVFVSVQPGLASPYEGTMTDAIDVFFMGEVNTPGLVQVATGTTFLQALAQSGGLTRFAATKRIQLRRTDPRTNVQKVYQIDYKALSRGAVLAKDIRLLDGDVILVPERRLFE
ncbi:polysaccharide biosynthesis/export family protein [Rhodovulum sulfidophilum]|uniref:Polysaccharide export protein n=1 Tax=Rhodovulum sulfidophilum TaxID=35806 RepID=A0ABS1RW02_RHOSU|nr:polysaccharide biosynthesis/export family protein [Rhodovulum sulfidophilum]MBL3610279.1 polysaccharide export protein [Rhodovulum sulfidophilum]MCE8455101.1 polysaccharide export protein [Rhodovulum sulfidophilum]